MANSASVPSMCVAEMKTIAIRCTQLVIILALVAMTVLAILDGKAMVTLAVILTSARAIHAKMVPRALSRLASLANFRTAQCARRSCWAYHQQIRTAARALRGSQMECVSRAGTASMQRILSSIRQPVRSTTEGIVT